MVVVGNLGSPQGQSLTRKKHRLSVSLATALALYYEGRLPLRFMTELPPKNQQRPQGAGREGRWCCIAPAPIAPEAVPIEDGKAPTWLSRVSFDHSPSCTSQRRYLHLWFGWSTGFDRDEQPWPPWPRPHGRASPLASSCSRRTRHGPTMSFCGFQALDPPPAAPCADPQAPAPSNCSKVPLPPLPSPSQTLHPKPH